MSAGAVAGGVVGGVIGFFVGGPAGAAIGFSIGMSVGGMLDPVKGPSQPGPQINDKNFQTAKYGDMLSRFYGAVPVFGNVTWIEGGKLKVTIRKKKSGGKGGSAKAAPVAYYSATFFLSLGLGPIAGIRRIWCSDKLIYNAGSDDLETIIASNQAATGFRVYLGTDDQLPDPRYEADVGVGNASAYRGEAYIAFYDFQLADFGNSLQGAQFKVEVVTASSSLSARQISDTVVDGYPADYAMRPYLTGDGTAFTFYAYDPDAGFDEDFVPNVETALVMTYLGGFAGQRALPAGFIRPLIVSTGNERVDVGLFGDDMLHAFEYAMSDPILSDVLLPIGDTGIDLLSAIPAEAGRYLQGMTIAQDGAHALVLTGASSWQSAKSADRYFIIDTALAVVESGTISGVSSTLLASGIATLNNGFITFDVARGTGWNADLRTNELKVGHITTTGGVMSCELISTVSVPAGGYPTGCLSDGMFYVATYYGGAMHWAVYTDSPQITIESVPLASVIESEVSLSSLLTAGDIDTSLLTADVRGYRVSGGSIRSALEPLQGAYPFDIIQSGYHLKCVPRGQASAVTIPWEDLGAADGDTPGDLLQESREMDSQLPALVAVKYLDAAREYAVGEQSKARINTQAINRVDREVSLVLTADEAAAMADVLVNLPWLERTPAKFTLPPPYLDLEPSDVVTVVTPDATHEFRLTDINYTPDGRLECEAKPNRAALYTSTAKGGEGVPPTGTIPLAGQSLLVLLDLPVVDETVQNAPGFGAVAIGYTPGWPGAVAFRSIDAGQTWSELQGFTGLPTLGYARGTLPASACTLIDQRTLVVDLIAGELESVTRDQMLAGINYAAYGANGRWEIVRFQNATLQVDGSYLLSHFVRGDRGTEWATGLHQAGDLLVLLDDPENVFVDMAVGSIGVPATYRSVTSGATIDSASDVPFTYQGVNLEPLSPVSARAIRDSSGNLSGTFVPRSRLSSSWWTTGVPGPVGEATEAYDIDVMDGSAVVRTITATSPEFDYSAANQVTDFGSTQASITFRIYQQSSVVGRGYSLEVTL